MSVIGATGTAGGTGHVIEYCGEAIRELSMEGRMTVCNMAIEGGARAGLIAPDEKTFDYVKGRPHAPKGAQWEAALAWWKTLYSDEGAHWDKVVTLKGEDIAPVGHLGHLARGRAADHRQRARRRTISTAARSMRRSAALDYMGLKPGTRLPTSRSTRSSSAPAPTAGSRTCAPPPRC